MESSKWAPGYGYGVDSGRRRFARRAECCKGIKWCENVGAWKGIPTCCQCRNYQTDDMEERNRRRLVEWCACCTTDWEG